MALVQSRLHIHYPGLRCSADALVDMGEAIRAHLCETKPTRVMRTGLRIAFWLIFGFAAGFLQENLKVSVNFVLDQSVHVPGYFELPPKAREEAMDAQRVLSPLDYYHSHQPISWIYRLERQELVGMKWGLTLLFVLVFLIINSRLLMMLTGNRSVLRALQLGYMVVFSISFAVYVLGQLLDPAGPWYVISRKLTGALQSMVPAVIMLPAWYLYRHYGNDDRPKEASA